MVTQTETFNYEQAFSRNRGFILAHEQEKLRQSTVAVAGLGGMGGAQVLALTRAGLGGFRLADPDTFELSNFNRQMGATVQALGKKKTIVMQEMILQINPDAHVTTFDDGVHEKNLEAFLDGVNVVVDALDFHCFKERKILYQKAREKKIWIVNVAPTGFGASLLLFDPRGMSFEEYFDFHPQMSEEENAFAMGYGVSPEPLILRYLDRKALDLKKSQLPCVGPGFFVAAGIAATETVNILLKKKTPRAVPWVFQFDALLHCYKKKYYFMGMRSPWQRFKKWIVFNTLRKKSSA